MKPKPNQPLFMGNPIEVVYSLDDFAAGFRIKTVINGRYDQGTYIGRGGISTALKASPGAGTCVGGASFRNGSLTEVYAAMDNAGAVDVYELKYNGSSYAAWSKLTTGSTQLSSPVGLVTFSRFTDKDGNTITVAADGVGKPFVYTQTVGQKVIDVDAPANGVAKHTPLYSKYGTVFDTGNSSANVTAGFSGGGNHQYTATAAVTSETPSFTYSSAQDFSDSDQLWVIIKDDYEWLDLSALGGDVGLSLTRTSGGDLALDDDRLEVRIPCGEGLYLAAFRTDDVDVSSVTGHKLTIGTTGVANGESLTVYAICAGGKVPGGAQYTVSNSTQYRVSESPGAVFVNKQAEPGDVSPNLPSGFFLPILSALKYAPTVELTEPAQSGVQYCNIYRQDTSSALAYLVGTKDMDTLGSFSYQDNTAVYDVDFAAEAPDAWAITIPAGVSYGFADRHYIGTTGKVYVSDEKEPLRFREITDESPVLGYGWAAKVGGDEEVTGFSAVASSVIGFPVVYAHTSKGIYNLTDDGRILRTSTTGTDAGGSTVTHEGTVWFLGNDRQTYALSGVMRNVSRWKVDSLFRAVDDDSTTSAAYFDNRFYINLPGETVTLNEGEEDESTVYPVLVFNTNAGIWESLDYWNIEPAIFLKWNHRQESRLLFLGTDGALYEAETGWADDGTAYQFELLTGMLHNQTVDSDRCLISQSKVCATGLSSARSFRYQQGNASGSDNGTFPDTTDFKNCVDKYTTNSTEHSPGTAGQTVRYRFVNNVNANFRLYSLVAEYDNSHGHGAVAQ